MEGKEKGSLTRRSMRKEDVVMVGVKIDPYIDGYCFYRTESRYSILLNQRLTSLGGCDRNLTDSRHPVFSLKEKSW